MSKKNVFRTDVVDGLTGEVLSSKATYVSRSTEKFIMIRTTEGLDWYLDLGKNEKGLVLLLHTWSCPVSMIVSLSPLIRSDIAEKLSIKSRMLSYLLKSLEASDCIIRITNNDFMINPSHLFKCSTTEIGERIERYKSHKK